MATELITPKEEFYNLLSNEIPPIKTIQKTLEKILPADIDSLITLDPALSHILNYYFCLFDSTIGARFINSRKLPMNSLRLLFDAQMGRYYTSSQSGNHEYSHRFFMNSYWRHLSEDRLFELFETLIRADNTSVVSAVMLLPKINPASLDLLNRNQAIALLEAFSKKEDSFRFLIQINPDIIDTLYRLARDLGDAENPYITFLNSHATYAVQLRIAEIYIPEAQSVLDQRGVIPLKHLVNILEKIPSENIEPTLSLFEIRGFIKQETLRGIRNIWGRVRQ